MPETRAASPDNPLEAVAMAAGPNPGPLPSSYADMATRGIVDLEYMGRGWYRITRINVPVVYRGRGIGRLLLRQVLVDADAHGITLTLEPVASPIKTKAGNLGLGPRQLTRWYQRYGFYWCTSDGSPALRSHQRMFMRRDPGGHLPNG